MKIDASDVGVAVLSGTLEENTVSPDEALGVRGGIMRKMICHVV
jgi:hypothetical protein